MIFRKFLSLFAVLASTLVVLATSKVQHHHSNAELDLTSDCLNPTLNMSVTVSGNQVVAPAGVTYMTFGFPTAVVIPNESSVGVNGSVTRDCQPTYANRDDGDWIYSCFDNGTLACSIYMKSR